MSKGMSEAQKNRVRGYLDTFKGEKGTCLLCNKKSADFCTVPEQTDQQGVPLPFLHLHVYGLCAKHADSSDVDTLAEAKVSELKTSYQDDKPEQPKLMTVLFSKQDGEEVKWAASKYI